MNKNYLDFEQPIAELEEKIEELRHVGTDSEINITEEISRLEIKSKELTKSIFKNLSAWQVVQLARHPKRPHALDYIKEIFTDFDELHGDRAFSDDKALVAGIARIDEQPVMVICQQKGRDTKEKIERNFGSMHPEGYRRAKRLMEMAEKFKLPIVTLIDTPGAYPGIGAESRGQSEAISRNLFLMAKLKVPIVCIVIGEGCSGGALGIGVGDRMLMMQYSYYATISPEGCATILFRSVEKKADAAEMMGITADKLLALGIVDGIIPEPLGGAHRDHKQTAQNLKQHIKDNLNMLCQIPIESLLEQRYEKIMALGNV